jgi:lipopolysaccharide export system protein LptC
MLASAQNAEQRSRIYDRLMQRNRLVSILRIGLPVIGAVVLAGLLFQIVLASLLDQFGISNISIDRDNLVVETPSYSSMTADGTMYTIASDDARAALGDTDLLRLSGATLMVTKPSGAWMEAKAVAADMRLSAQTVYVPDVMEIQDSRGTSGTIIGVRTTLLGESMVSDGAAKIRYHNGTTLDAESMAYDAKAQRWEFKRATLVVPSTPGASPAASTVPTQPAAIP